MPPAAPLPMEIECAAVKQLMDGKADFVLLDCREDDEHALVHIHAAQLLPMSQLMNRVGELEAHRECHVVVHCHHGGRSMKVTQWLRSQGFAKVQSMAGGIDQWAAEIDTALKRY